MRTDGSGVLHRLAFSLAVSPVEPPQCPSVVASVSECLRGSAGRWVLTAQQSETVQAFLKFNVHIVSTA